ncbi:MAG: hypothetical protein JNK04_25675, partial [Myxococcales bacterium]|nr:hypothetical protein [Myxococcales bacterium]
MVDAGEDCDDGAESASCNADCTTATCGDGTRNKTAGEGCDDGNTADGDACDASCVPSVMVLSDPGEGSVASATVAHSGGVFSTVWSTNTLGIAFKLATIGPAGITNETALGTSMKEYGFVSIASNSDGRAMIFGIHAFPGDIVWRFAAPGGALEPGSGGAADETFAPAGPGFAPFFDKFSANASGEFCALAGDGATRCTQGDALLPPVTSLPGGGISSATLLDRGSDGYFVGYVFGPDFRSFTMDSDGASTGPVVPLGAASFDARAGGGLVRPDGTF